MRKKDFIIPFVGLKEGKHQFNFEIDSTFFEIYPYDDILDAKVNVDLEFIKKSTLMELDFNANGTIEVSCDLTNELFWLPINGDLSLVVKFGDVYNDENEDVLIIPHEAYELDIAQYIYEMIVLALPSKRIHPGVEDGTLQSEILDKLKDLEPKEKTKTESSDPRWDKLKELLNDKKV